MKEARVAPVAILVWGLVIAAGILGIAFFDRKTFPLAFIACTALAGIAYLRTLGLLGRIGEGSRRVLAFCLVLSAAWRVPLLLNPPTLSSDVYRYVWDGRIQHLGYYPYMVGPNDRAVRHLHTPETLLMNHPDFPTPYSLPWRNFFRAVTMVDASARAMKAAAFLCDAALVAILLWWLSGSHRSPWWVLAYAWNPLVALEGADNGHVDLLERAISGVSRRLTDTWTTRGFCDYVRARSRGKISPADVSATIMGAHPSSRRGSRRRNPCRALPSIFRPRPVAAGLARRLFGSLACQRSDVFGPRSGPSRPGPWSAFQSLPDWRSRSGHVAIWRSTPRKRGPGRSRSH